MDWLDLGWQPTQSGCLGLISGHSDLNRESTGEEIIRVNGGSVTRLDAPVNWAGYIVSQI